MFPIQMNGCQQKDEDDNGVIHMRAEEMRVMRLWAAFGDE